MTEDWLCLERPGSPGLIPGLKGVTNGAGLVLDIPFGRTLERRGVMNDEGLAKPVCGALGRRGDMKDEGLENPVCGTLGRRGDMNDEELAKPVCGVLENSGLALTEADKG